MRLFIAAAIGSGYYVEIGDQVDQIRDSNQSVAVEVSRAPILPGLIKMFREGNQVRDGNTAVHVQVARK